MYTLQRCLLILAVATAIGTPVWAQFQPIERRDSGKCTIEVWVDNTAEVNIRGDRAILRTINGQQAQWRRFECSGPMPPNPSDFKFTGIDGRGRQDLVQDPRNGGGETIVRIEDRQGGGEGYTFDVEWRGGNFNPGPGYQQPMRDRDNVQGERRDDRRDERQMERREDRHDERRDMAIQACQRAAERRIQRGGFRDVRFDWPNTEGRRNDSIAGRAVAERGSGDRQFEFEVSCAINVENGSVRSLQVRRR